MTNSKPTHFGSFLIKWQYFKDWIDWYKLEFISDLNDYDGAFVRSAILMVLSFAAKIILEFLLDAHIYEYVLQFLRVDWTFLIWILDDCITPL